MNKCHLYTEVHVFHCGQSLEPAALTPAFHSSLLRDDRQPEALSGHQAGHCEHVLQLWTQSAFYRTPYYAAAASLSCISHHERVTSYLQKYVQV